MAADVTDRTFRIQRRIYLLAFILILILVACIRIRLLNVPLERDEGEYAYIGQLMLQGKLPYLHAYTMKLPGTHALYALMMLLFGQTVAGVHGGLLLVNTFTSIMVYLLARRLAGDAAAATAGITFAVMSVSNSLLGTFAHATHFVILWVVAGLLLFLKWKEGRQTPALFLSGVLFGLAYTMKQHGIFFSAVPLLLLLIPSGSAVIPLRSRLGNFLVFTAGLALPLVLIVMVMALTGALDKFVFWTFSYAKAYTETMPLEWGWRIFLNQFSDVTRNTGAFWLLAGAGLAATFFSPLAKGNRLLLAALTLCSVAAILPGLHFRPHYFIQTLPALALLAGIAVATLPAMLPGRFSVAFSMALLAVVLGASATVFYGERQLMFFLPPAEVIKKSYQTAKPFAEAVEVAAFIRENSFASDKIMVIGSEPQIYFYANRSAGTGYIYLFSLMEDQPYAEMMQNEYLQEMAASDPRYVVVVNDVALLAAEGKSVGSFMGKANRFLGDRYDKVGVVDIRRDLPSRFVWGKGASLYTPGSTTYMLILERKLQNLRLPLTGK